MDKQSVLHTHHGTWKGEDTVSIWGDEPVLEVSGNGVTEGYKY